MTQLMAISKGSGQNLHFSVDYIIAVHACIKYDRNFINTGNYISRNLFQDFHLVYLGKGTGLIWGKNDQSA